MFVRRKEEEEEEEKKKQNKQQKGDFINGGDTKRHERRGFHREGGQPDREKRGCSPEEVWI